MDSFFGEQFDRLMSLLFSDAYKDYNGTEAIKLVYPDLKQIFDLWNACPGLGRKIEFLAFDYLTRVYVETQQAPSWQSFYQEITDRINSTQNIKEKDPSWPTVDDSASLSSFVSSMKDYHKGVAADAVPALQSYVKHLQKSAAADMQIEFQKNLGKGMEYLEAKEQLNSALQSLDVGQGTRVLDTWDDYRDQEQEYLEELQQRALGVDLYTGLTCIDQVVDGLSAGGYAVIGGYPGHGKSTLALNWVYRNLLLGRNMAFYTLEMSDKLTRRKFLPLHAKHPKFADRRVSPISYAMLKKGHLTPAQHELIYGPGGVAEDFNNLPGHVMFASLDKRDINSIKAQLDSHDADPNYPLHGFVLDHAGWLESIPSKNKPTHVCEAEIFMHLQNLCKNYKGRGLACLLPTQTTKQAYDKAQKNQGIYEIGCCARTFEIERSATYCFNIYSDEALKRAGECLISCTKNREGEQPTPFRAKFDPVSGLVTDMDWRTVRETEENPYLRPDGTPPDFSL